MTENYKSDDLSEVLINTVQFIKRHLILLISFTLIGLGFGVILNQFTSEKYTTFFVIENGGLPSEIIKDVATPDSTQNFTVLSNEEYKEKLSLLSSVTELVADTTGRNNSIKYNIKLSDTLNTKDIQNTIVTFLGTNSYVNEYTQDELNRINNEIINTNKVINDLLMNSDSLEKTYQDKNLTTLLNRNQKLNQEQNKIGRFDIIQPIQSPIKESLDLTSYIMIGMILGIVIGVFIGYLKDVFLKGLKT